MSANKSPSTQGSKPTRQGRRVGSSLHDTEYLQANENLRFSFSMELAYFRFHINSVVLLLVAYWFTADVDLLRRLLAVLGTIISISGIIVEYRTIQYYRYFFDAILAIERANNLTQMSFLTKHVTAPPLNLRTSHMIYALFAIAVMFWIAILFSDLFHLHWFNEMLIRLREAKRAILLR